MISVKNLSKDFTGRKKFLDQISFELAEGEFAYLLGATGSGKSTLLRILAGEESPSLGSLKVFGKNFRAGLDEERQVREVLGYVPQISQVLHELSVEDALEFSRVTSRFPLERRKVLNLLELLGLRDKVSTSVGHLSGGETQRLSVALALVRNPKVLLCDEPTGAQDRHYAYVVMDLILKQNQAGATVLVATHDQDVMKRIQKRCLRLQVGKIREESVSCYF